MLVEGAAGFGHCYSSDPAGYWPLRLRDHPEDRGALEQLVPQAEVARIAAETPYCIVYDLQKRRAGFFPSRATQVALVGDSFCFGEGLRDEDTLAYQLGLRCGQCNFRNLGWPGTDVETASRAVRAAIERLPDLAGIVYVYNLNDIPDADNTLAGGSLTDLENIRWRAGDVQGSLAWLERSALLRLVRRTLTLRRVTGETERRYNAMYLGESGRGAGFRRTLDLLGRMRDEARAAGVKFTVVVYPLLHKDLLGAYPFEKIHEVILRECRELGIRCVDAAPAFAAHRSLKSFTLHEIDLHPNGRANRLVAEYLGDADRLGLRPPAGADVARP